MAGRGGVDLSYDEDELEGYEEDEHVDESQSMTCTCQTLRLRIADLFSQDLSAEDEENMRQGTIAVRADLGEDSNFSTDKEIRDSLWYYYYDIDKTVAYLRKQRRPEQQQSQPAPKKQKQPSKFDQAVQAQAGELNPDFFHFLLKGLSGRVWVEL